MFQHNCISLCVSPTDTNCTVFDSNEVNMPSIFKYISFIKINNEKIALEIN